MSGHLKCVVYVFGDEKMEGGIEGAWNGANAADYLPDVCSNYLCS